MKTPKTMLDVTYRIDMLSMGLVVTSSCGTRRFVQSLMLFSERYLSAWMRLIDQGEMGGKALRNGSKIDMRYRVQSADMGEAISDRHLSIDVLTSGYVTCDIKTGERYFRESFEAISDAEMLFAMRSLAHYYSHNQSEDRLFDVWLALTLDEDLPATPPQSAQEEIAP